MTTASDMIAAFHDKEWTPDKTAAFLTLLFAEFEEIEESDEIPGLYAITFADGSWVNFDNSDTVPRFTLGEEQPDTEEKDAAGPHV